MSAETTTTGINLTAGAAEKVAALLAQEGRDDLSPVSYTHLTLPTTSRV